MTYKKSKGNAGLEGVQFQLNLLIVFLLNALHSKKNWKISTENQEAGKFDDLVFDLEDKCVLLQAKFKQHKKINKEQLLSCNSKTSDFSLPKYFFSYLEVKSEPVEKTVIICTNTSVDQKGLETFLTRQSVRPDSMLHYEGATCTFFTFDERILPDLKANAVTYLQKNLQGKGVDEAAVTEENLKDFLDHFQFFSNFPGNERLEAIIGQLLLRLNCSSLYRGVSSQEIYNKVEEWFKQPKGEYLNEMRAKAMFSEIKSDRFCEELKSHNVSFARGSFEFTDPKRIFHFNSEGNPLLQALRVYDALQRDESRKLYVNSDDGVEVQKRMVEAFALPRFVFLIVIGNKITQGSALKEFSDGLKEVLKKYGYKKVILVAKRDDKLCQEIGASDLFYVDGPVTFKDLSLDCQMTLAKRTNIIFQGTRISLEELFTAQTNEYWTGAVDAEILEGLIRNRDIKVGEPPVQLNEFNANCYIYRTFKRKVLKKLKSNEETLRQKLFLDIDEESGRKEESFAEKDIYDVKEEVVLVSDTAGMGKTTVLSKLAGSVKEQNPHLWVIKIELADYTGFLRDVLKNKKTVNVTDLLNARSSTKLRNYLERFVFLTENKMVLMVDGIDEISPDYTKLVLHLLSQCMEATNFAKLFVTTRPHMVRELEEVLKVKAFELKSFTDQNQVDFLTSYWAQNLDVDDEGRRNCEVYACALISRMSSWTKGHHNKEDDFTAIPLQLGMLAEIFQESIKRDDASNWEGCKEFLKNTKSGPRLPEKMEIKNLYDMFVEKKRDIYISKGNPSGNAAANMALTDQFSQSLVHHRTLALKVILNVENLQLFSCYEQGYEDADERILKIGIVQKSNAELHFAHRTFAEYFVAECIAWELQLQADNPSVKFQKLFLEEILQLSEYKIIRAFLDNFLQEVDSLPPTIFDKYDFSTHYPDYWTQDVNLLHSLGEEGCTATMKLILKCVDFKIVTDQEFNMADLHKQVVSLRSVFETLGLKLGFKKEKGGNILKAVHVLVRAGGLNVKDKFGRTPLHYAASGGHFEMVRFLVERGVKTDVADKDGHTALHYVAMTEDLDSVKYLARSKEEVDIKDTNGLTALHFAAANGRGAILELFLALDADFNVTDKYGRTPLHLAASEGHLHVIKFILKLGVDFRVTDRYGRTPQHLSASNGFLDIVEFLLELGADSKVRDNYNRTPLHLAASNGHLETVKFLVSLGVELDIRDSYNRTPLHLAASNGHLETVKYILTAGVDFGIKDNYSHTPLHLASSNGHIGTVKFLLELGADFAALDKDGCMTMNLAASNGHLNTVRLFLDLGVRFNVEDKYGRLPLHLAASNGHLDMVKFLLQLDADCNVRDKEGRSPLHLAASNGHLDTVKFFLEIDAAVNAVDDSNRTPLHLAALNGYLDTVKFLKERGAYSRGME